MEAENFVVAAVGAMVRVGCGAYSTGGTKLDNRRISKQTQFNSLVSIG
jgi:hypothetical protein